MRKHQKQNILTILDELDSMIIETAKAAGAYDYEKVQELLTECQNSVIQVGTFIENTEPESQATVAMLEEFCEDIYHASQVLLKVEEIAACEYKLRQSVQMIRKNIEDNIRVKYEIIFLPYSAAMWDSLESIWLSAKDDINCECYVIPIPYFEREANGQDFFMRYDGDLMPDYVPITNYLNYDMAEKHPDVIYIHNPYDKFNHVTSVHPDYYSSELKKYTDMLVYVPYFVTGGSMADTFYELPSYYHVDKIVIQSEEMRKYYSDEISDDKFLTLGSPKFDRILAYEKDKPQISEEWRQIIGDKKVIFYNTSISSILSYNVKALDKMKYVISCFHSRDDVVLLWRPHPLTKATLKAIRPLLLEEFQKIEQDFIDNKIGIYDTSPDVTVSIAISDAYIGEDSSSVVPLFGMTGKPIFILNMNIAEDTYTDEQLSSVAFCDCCVDGDYIWFVSLYFNVLCKMNLTDGIVEEVAELGEVTLNSIQYMDVIKVESQIFILPYQAKALCIYNLEDKSIRKVEIANPVSYNFDRMIRYKDYIFLKPKCYPAIVRYDIRNGSCVYYDKCIKEFLQPDNRSMFLWGVSVRDNLLLMASCNENKVLEFNMDTGETKVHMVGQPGNNYFSMAYDGSDYWLIQESNKAIVRWNYETGRTIEYSDYPSSIKEDARLFVGMVHCNSHMLAFPKCTNTIISIDIGTGQMSEYDSSLTDRIGERKYNLYHHRHNYYFAKQEGKLILAVSAFDNSILIINSERNTYQIYKCSLSSAKANRLRLERIPLTYDNNDYLPYFSKEDPAVTVIRFLDNMFKENVHNSKIQRTAYRKLAVNTDGTCGAAIHNNIINEIKISVRNH